MAQIPQSEQGGIPCVSNKAQPNSFTFGIYARDLALIAFVVVALLWKVVFTPRSFYWGDLMLYFQPMYAYAARLLGEGRIPLWNPYVLCGQPFIGNPQIGLFFPAALLLPFRHTWQMMNADDVLFLMISGFTMYGLIMELTHSRISSVTAATVWCGCGPVLGRIQFPPMFYAIALMPAGVWAAHRFLTRPTVLSWCWLVVANSLMILAAHPQVAYLEFSLLLMLPLSFGLPKRRFAMRSYLGILSALVAGVLLCAVQLLPVIELASQSSRQLLTLWAANRFHLEPSQLLSFLAPRFFGTPVRGDYWGSGNFWEPAPFMGWLPLAVLAYVALPVAHKSRTASLPTAVRFWLLAVLLCVWAAIGAQGGLYNILFFTMPGLAKFHDPARFLIPAALAVSVLTGLQLEPMLGVIRSRNAALRNPVVLHGIVFMFTFGPLMWYAGDLLPTAPTSHLAMPSNAVPQTVREQTGRIYLPLHTLFADQFIGAGYLDYGSTTRADLRGELTTLNPNLQMRADIVSASGYEPVPLDSYVNIERAAMYALFNNGTNLGSLMSLLGVSTVAVPRAYHLESPALRPYHQWPNGGRKSLRWYHNSDYMGAIWITGSARNVSGNLRIVAALGDPEFRARREALLTDAPAGLAESVSQGGPLRASVTDISQQSTSLTALVVANRPALAVISFMAYPGWYGKLDGQPISLLKADGGLIGAAIPAGTHRLTVSYRPKVFVVALYVSLVSLSLILAVMIGITLAKRKQHKVPK